jgi:hypothetical protein
MAINPTKNLTLISFHRSWTRTKRMGLTVRSFVRKRHQLQIVDRDVWTFDTPFF